MTRSQGSPPRELRTSLQGRELGHEAGAEATSGPGRSCSPVPPADHVPDLKEQGLRGGDRDSWQPCLTTGAPEEMGPATGPRGERGPEAGRQQWEVCRQRGRRSCSRCVAQATARYGLTPRRAFREMKMSGICLPPELTSADTPVYRLPRGGGLCAPSAADPEPGRCRVGPGGARPGHPESSGDPGPGPPRPLTSLRNDLPLETALLRENDFRTCKRQHLFATKTLRRQNRSLQTHSPCPGQPGPAPSTMVCPESQSGHACHGGCPKPARDPACTRRRRPPPGRLGPRVRRSAGGSRRSHVLTWADTRARSCSQDPRA